MLNIVDYARKGWIEIRDPDFANFSMITPKLQRGISELYENSHIYGCIFFDTKSIPPEERRNAMPLQYIINRP
jgi:hypothetical protein